MSMIICPHCGKTIDISSKRQDRLKDIEIELHSLEASQKIWKDSPNKLWIIKGKIDRLMKEYGELGGLE